MEDITSHMPQCVFADGNVPGWYATYMKSKEKEYEEQELKEDLLVIYHSYQHHRMMALKSSTMNTCQSKL